MAFIRQRKCKGELAEKHGEHSYQLIQTYREGGKVKQRVLANLSAQPTVAKAVEWHGQNLRLWEEKLENLAKHREVARIHVEEGRKWRAECEAKDLYCGERQPENEGVSYQWPLSASPEWMAEMDSALAKLEPSWKQRELMNIAALGRYTEEMGRALVEGAWEEYRLAQYTVEMKLSFYRITQEIAIATETIEETKGLLATLREHEKSVAA